MSEEIDNDCIQVIMLKDFDPENSGEKIIMRGVNGKNFVYRFVAWVEGKPGYAWVKRNWEWRDYE